jgi:hypothetical protein
MLGAATLSGPVHQLWSTLSECHAQLQLNDPRLGLAVAGSGVCGYIRDLFTVNKSLLLNAVWKIATGKNQFLSDILKAKYYPNSSFWLAGNHSTKSAFWASITSIKKHSSK